MKHLVHRHPRQSTSEWLSALFTLAILLGIYGSMDNFSSYSSLYDVSSSGSYTVSLSSPYWNAHKKYGFQILSGNRYTQNSTDTLDSVLIEPEKSSGDTNGRVRVDFYTNTSISDIEKRIDTKLPRVYSRLPNGIAVITGDLNSPSAKTILATLYSN